MARLLPALFGAALPVFADSPPPGSGLAGGEPRLWRTVDDLPGDRVQALAQADDGYLWVGTAYGLARFDGFRFSVFDPGSLGVANLGNVILESGPDNTMWIGTERGEVLFWSGGTFTSCLPRTDTTNAVWGIYPEGGEGAAILKKEGLWRWNRKTGARLLGAPGPLELFTGRQGLFSARTSRDSSGDLYFFSLQKCWRLRGNIVEQVEPAKEGINASRLWDVNTGADGTVWLITEREMLWRNPDRKWTALPGLEDSRWGGFIMGGCPDGSMWMAMNTRLRRVSRAGWLVDAGAWPPEGLNSPGYTDPGGRLWVALSTGVLRCIHMDGTVREFPPSATIRGVAVSRFFMDREGNLWGGTGNSGLLCWTAEQTATLCGTPPPVTPPEPELHLESCRLGETETAFPFPAQGLTAPPDTHRLELRYTAILLGAPESVRFRHRLQGLETSWRETSSREVRYDAVPAGRYRFEVQAMRAGGSWGPALSLPLTLKGYFWQTRWFRLLGPGAAIAAAGIAGWIISRRRSARRLKVLELDQVRSAERLRLARDLHDDLGSRLTHLSLLADLAGCEPRPSTQTLDTLRDGLRTAIGSLDAIVWTVDPRRDTLPDLAEYLAATLTTFFSAAGLSCAMDNPAALPPLAVPSDRRHHLLMSVREAAQNVLKHARATRIILHWTLTGHLFRFSLTDNGRGFDPDTPAAEGDGLRNLRERLAACGGSLDISSAPGEGTQITLSIAISEPPFPA